MRDLADVARGGHAAKGNAESKDETTCEKSLSSLGGCLNTGTNDDLKETTSVLAALSQDHVEI